MQALITARLAALSSTARETARLAATVGRDFSFDILAGAGNIDEATLVSALNELWQRRIIREGHTNTFDFNHDRIREAAYAEGSPVKRRDLHRRVAEALEHHHRDDLGSVSASLAVHHER